MELNTPDERDRGQVGIGTLIVFIAMVLVAAIAAGVLINTAGFLQTKSQQTGEQSGEQVTNRIQLASITSQNISGSTNRVVQVNATASRAPGADTINLKEVTIQWVGPEVVKTLKHGGAETLGSDGTGDLNYAVRPNATHFTTTILKNAAGGANDVLNSDADVVRFSFAAGSGASASGEGITNGLDPGDQVTLRVVTASNGRTVQSISVPDSLTGKSVVSL